MVNDYCHIVPLKKKKIPARRTCKNVTLDANAVVTFHACCDCRILAYYLKPHNGAVF